MPSTLLILSLVLSSLSAIVSARRLPGLTPHDPDVRWTEAGKSVLVKLDLWGLPLKSWNIDAHSLQDVAPSSAVVLNFTISSDKKSLLLQDQPFLPIPDPNVPPHIWALQVPVDLSDEQFGELMHEGYFDPRRNVDLRWRPVGLSYDRLVDPQESSWKTHDVSEFTLQMDLIGAEFSHGRDLTLLDQKRQKRIIMQITDEQDRRDPNAPDRAFAIRKVLLKKRRDDYVTKRPHRFDDCTLTRWRCGDFQSEPYYRYVWLHEFSPFFGRRGSLREFLLRRWVFFKHGVAMNWGVIAGILLGVFGLVFARCYFWLMSRRQSRNPYELIGGEGEDYMSDEEDDDLDEEEEDKDPEDALNVPADSPPSYEDVVQGRVAASPPNNAAAASASIRGQPPPIPDRRHGHSKPLPPTPTEYE